MRTGRNTSVRHIIHALLHGPNIACFFILHNIRVNFTNLSALCLLYARWSVFLSAPARTSQWTETVSSIRTFFAKNVYFSENTAQLQWLPWQPGRNSLHHPSGHVSIYLSVCLTVRPSVYLRPSSGGNCVSPDNRASGQPVIQPSTVTYRSSPWAPVRICLRCSVRTHSTMLTAWRHPLVSQYIPPRIPNSLRIPSRGWAQLAPNPGAVTVLARWKLRSGDLRCGAALKKVAKFLRYDGDFL